MLKNIILNNPLRSLGLTATNSYREFQERLDEVEAFKAIGQYPTYDSDFSFLDTFVRDEKIINLSKELVTNKVELNKYSLFWFIRLHNSVDPLLGIPDNNTSFFIQKQIYYWHT